MKALERNAARDAMAAAMCGACRPIVRFWFTHADAVDLDERLCPRCVSVVDRMLGDLMRHYEKQEAT
jgi:hypothetical protein